MATSVECSNCGGIGPEFWLTLGALALAAIAGWYASVPPTRPTRPYEEEAAGLLDAYLDRSTG